MMRTWTQPSHNSSSVQMQELSLWTLMLLAFPTDDCVCRAPTRCEHTAFDVGITKRSEMRLPIASVATVCMFCRRRAAALAWPRQHRSPVSVWGRALTDAGIIQSMPWVRFNLPPAHSSQPDPCP
eukprot:4755279-Amphidinium_carterae.1